MTKISKSQIIIVIVLTSLLLLTPLLSSSLRPKYLYFIINLIIIALGAESGLFSSLFSTHNLHLDLQKTPLTKGPTESNSGHSTMAIESVPNENSSIRFMEEKVIMEKCPSKPSLLFIGSLEDQHQEELLEDISGQELFTKAETFIENFYKQLKIQREEMILEKDSWLLS